MRKADYNSVVLPLIMTVFLHSLILGVLSYVMKSLPVTEIKTEIPFILSSPSKPLTDTQNKKKPAETQKRKLIQESKEFNDPRKNLENQNTALNIAKNSAREKEKNSASANPESLQNSSIKKDNKKLEKQITPIPPIKTDRPLKLNDDNPNTPLKEQDPPSIFKKQALNRFPQNKEEEKKQNPADFIPGSIRPSLRDNKPEPTQHDVINYTLSNYGWSFEYYAEQWASAIRQWWRLPSDYGTGKVPNGGSVWISVKLSKAGEFLDYKVYKSGVTPEMEVKTVQALISSFERPPLPDSFPDETLTVNWQFIYMPVNAFREPSN